MLPGHPLKESSLYALGQLLAKPKKLAIKLEGTVPANLLWMNVEKQTLIWTKSSHRSMILFDTTIKLKSQVITHPGLIFKSSGTNLYVFAYDPSKKLDQSTQLHYAPYLNLHQEHNICKGSASIQPVHAAGSFFELMEAWENVFFKSKFSHGTGTDIPRVGKLTNRDFMDELAKAKKFPYNRLKKTKLYFRSICK